MDTKEMFDLIKRGDQRGWDEFYRQTYDKAIVIAREIVGKNGNDYESVVQDAYLKAYTKIDTINDPENYRAWFNRIVKNTALTQVGDKPKGDRYSVYNESIVSSINAPIDNGDEDSDELSNIIDITAFNQNLDIFNPEDLMDKAYVREAVAEFIDGLSEDKRKVIGLRFYSGLTNLEIANILNISENTVKSRFKRALEELQNRRGELEKKGIRISGIAMLIMLLKWHYVGDTAYAAEFLTETGKEAAKTYVDKMLKDAGVDTLASTSNATKAVVDKSPSVTTTTTTASSGVSNAVKMASVTKTATTTTKAGALIGKAIVTKTIAGVAAAAVIGGGVFTGIKAIKTNTDSHLTEGEIIVSTEYTEEINDGIIEDTTVKSDCTYTVVSGPYDDTVSIINADENIKTNIENLYLKYNSEPYNSGSLINYNDKILSFFYIRNAGEHKGWPLLINYDATTGKQLLLSDVVTDIDAVCEGFIEEWKQKLPDFDEAAFREVFATFETSDDSKRKRILWSTDENGLWIIAPPYYLTETEYENSDSRFDNSNFYGYLEFNATKYIKNEYNTKIENWGMSGLYDYESQRSFFVLGDFNEETSRFMPKLTVHRYNSSQLYDKELLYECDISQYGVKDGDIIDIPKGYLIKNNGNKYLYIAYEDYSKTLVFNVTEEVPVFVGIHEGSYFQIGMLMNNTKEFPMFFNDMAYGMYTIDDTGMPQRLDDKVYQLEFIEY